MAHACPIMYMSRVCACTHILNKLKVIFKDQDDIKGGMVMAHAFILRGKWRQVDQRADSVDLCLLCPFLCATTHSAFYRPFSSL